MAIIYNFTKYNDDNRIEVQQDTSIQLYYLSDNTNTILEDIDVLANTVHTLGVSKDGKYKIVLNAEGESTVEFEFFVLINLQKSITIDTLNLLCNNCDCGCGDVATATCLTKSAKKCLKHRGVFVKLLSYQSVYLSSYGENFVATFAEFLDTALKTFSCKPQSKINKLLYEECFYGDIKDTEELFKLYLALHWFTMYYIEYKLVENGEQEQIDYLNTKFKYKEIVDCLCTFCIEIDKLKELFDDISETNNTAPTVEDYIITLSNIPLPSGVIQHIFTGEEFTNNFQDAEGDSPNNIRIGSVPIIGMLTYLGSIINAGFIININNISGLRYVLPANYSITDTGIYEFEQNVQQIINICNSQGYNLESYQNGLMTFVRVSQTLLTVDTNIYAFIDTTSMSFEDADACKNGVKNWFFDYQIANPNYQGNLYIIPSNNERWLRHAISPITGTFFNLNLNVPFGGLAELPPNYNSPSWVPDTSAIVLCFVDEATPEYHSNAVSKGFDTDIIQPTSLFTQDYIDFINIYPQYNVFKGVLYPIIRSLIGEGGACVLQMVASLKGRLLTAQEISNIGSPIDLSLLLTENAYTNYAVPATNPVVILEPLENYNWSGNFTKQSPATDVFLNEDFGNEINAVLQSITVEDFEYKTIQGVLVADEIGFTFEISDDNNNELYSNMANINIEFAGYVNQPATVGNRNIELNNRINYVYTLADFTTLANPPYSDPEGDVLDAIRIDSLPAQGVLRVSGVPAVIGQIVTRAQILNKALSIDAPDVDTVAVASFDFSVRDSGSMQWSI